MNRLLGLSLVFVGSVLLLVGLLVSDSISQDLLRLFSGTPGGKASWLLLGGVLSILVGAAGLAFRRGARSHT